MTERVSFRGLLSGAGGDSPCIASALEVTLPVTKIVTYTTYAIMSVSLDLPDGAYKLLANGANISVTRHNGAWDILETQ